jgi:hypothetical protein
MWILVLSSLTVSLIFWGVVALILTALYLYVKWFIGQLNSRISLLKEPQQKRSTIQPAHKLEQGQSVLELLFALLILLPLIFGGIELSRGVDIRQSLASGTFIAARGLSLEPDEWGWALSTIQSSLNTNVLGGGAVSAPTVKIYNDSGSEITATALNVLPFGSPFRVEATVTYTPDIPIVGGIPITIQVSHRSLVERYP